MANRELKFALPAASSGLRASQKRGQAAGRSGLAKLAINKSPLRGPLYLKSLRGGFAGFPNPLIGFF